MFWINGPKHHQLLTQFNTCRLLRLFSAVEARFRVLEWCLCSVVCFESNPIPTRSPDHFPSWWHEDLLPLVVRQCDALWRHLEVHNSGSRWGSGSQSLRDGLGDGLRARQGLHLHRVDVEHIACWEDKRVPFSKQPTKMGEGVCFDLKLLMQL